MAGAPSFGGPLAVDDLATGAVGAALLAAAELAQARGAPVRAVELDAGHVATAFVSERHVRVHGEPAGAGFADLSRFARTADGWIRLHANYPHHRRALLEVIGEPEAIERWRAVELEDAVVAAGGCAAALRDEAAWLVHPQGAAVAELGLADLEPADAGAPPLRPLPVSGLPAAGLRVLDLTRVIAGPVGTRMLAALGAEVLRIDPPQLPELRSGWVDAGLGKRSALLDLREPAARRTFDALLAEADVLVHGYRPGALAAFGVEPAALAERHPHLTTVTLSAWGHVGPWAGRRGFDSLVQSASGIAAACGDPGALPAQALDHATGYLMAAAALRGLAMRAAEGRAAHARFALARTARHLLSLPRGGAPGTPPDPAPHLQELGAAAVVAPPGRLDGHALRWSEPARAYGGDAPRFAR